MDFTSSPHLDRTRAEFRTWLVRHLPNRDEWTRLHDHGTLRERVAFLKDWQQRLYDGRWIAVHWPSEYGGRGAPRLPAPCPGPQGVGRGAPPPPHRPSLRRLRTPP